MRGHGRIIRLRPAHAANQESPAEACWRDTAGRLSAARLPDRDIEYRWRRNEAICAVLSIGQRTDRPRDSRTRRSGAHRRSAPNNPFAVEYTIALTVLNLRRETDEKVRPEYIALAHKPDDAVEMEDVLRCPVRIGTAWSGVILSGQAWRLPFRRRDPVLRELLERQAKELVERLPSVEPVVRDVQRVLAKRVARGDTRIGEVARELATTARTLQRRLAGSGVTYQELVENTRCEAAEKYLASSSLSIAEVAYLLGYSEPSALHRAFKRWKNETPDAFRKSARRQS